MRRALAMSLALLALPLAADEFRVDWIRESLLGTYRHSTQLIDGVEVVGGERIERDARVVYERALPKTPVTIMAMTAPRANGSRGNRSSTRDCSNRMRSTTTPRPARCCAVIRCSGRRRRACSKRIPS
jgi:hypothetical protein